MSGPLSAADTFAHGAFHMLVCIERYQAMTNDVETMAAIRSEWRSDVAEAIIEVLFSGSLESDADCRRTYTMG